VIFFQNDKNIPATGATKFMFVVKNRIVFNIFFTMSAFIRLKHYDTGFFAKLIIFLRSCRAGQAKREILLPCAKRVSPASCRLHKNKVCKQDAHDTLRKKSIAGILPASYTFAFGLYVGLPRSFARCGAF
jgi:hypothetical protein